MQQKLVEVADGSKETADMGNRLQDRHILDHIEMSDFKIESKFGFGIEFYPRTVGVSQGTIVGQLYPWRLLFGDPSKIDLILSQE
uniref:Uncharacterized protein n=1 Tax=Romanomermis culicivorax TaxID=13658 RepID=A0A915HVC5_ROMCU